MTDFGSASQATSKRLNTTFFARGTESYRAPEVLLNYRFNNRADIFALGSIIYEILTGRKLFSSDWSILWRWEIGNAIFPELWPPFIPETRLHWLGMPTSSLLDNDAKVRPGAKQTKQYLHNIRVGLHPFMPSIDSILEEDIFLEEEGMSILPDQREVTVQTAFRTKLESLSDAVLISDSSRGVTLESSMPPKQNRFYLLISFPTIDELKIAAGTLDEKFANNVRYAFGGSFAALIRGSPVNARDLEIAVEPGNLRLTAQIMYANPQCFGITQHDHQIVVVREDETFSYGVSLQCFELSTEGYPDRLIDERASSLAFPGMCSETLEVSETLEG